MSKKPFIGYAITYGLEGCYMPDSHYGAFEVTSRRDFANLVKSALADYDMPKSLFRDVRVRAHWPLLARYGASSAHFTLYHKGNALSFHGLTREEYDAAQDDRA